MVVPVCLILISFLAFNFTLHINLRDLEKKEREERNTLIALDIFIKNSACSLVRDIGYPDSTQRNLFAFQFTVEVLPERLIGFLWVSISRRPDDGDCVIWNWSRAVERDILFYGELEGRFLFALGTMRVFSNVLTGNYVLDYLEGKRHYEIKGTPNRKITALLS